MNWELVIQPLLAGLSVGAFCLTYCFPFIGSFLAAEDRTFWKNVQVVFQFLAGRLAGYLCFGLLAGYLGEKFDTRCLRLATDLSLIVLSLLLVFYLLGLVKEKGIFCYGTPSLKNKSPALMGFLMGTNLCPPFLLSVAYVFQHQSAFYGAVYFALFFVSSSVYFLPLVFIGLAARAREFRTLARLSGLLVATLFFIYGVYSLIHNV